MRLGRGRRGLRRRFKEYGEGGMYNVILGGV